MENLVVKLMSLDPTGIVVKEKKLTMSLYDKDSMRIDRLFIEIGNCVYSIDRNGNIIEKIKNL